MDKGRYSPKTFVCSVVNGIAFYKELNLMLCSVMCLKLSCGIKKYRIFR